MPLETNSKFIIQVYGLARLVETLKGMGYIVIGPTVKDNVIVYDELDSFQDLPIGWTDKQDAGTYRLHKRTDDTFFGFNVGPHSWKKFLFPPNLLLWKAAKKERGFDLVVARGDEEPQYAFLGVRACELHAMEIQDKVFTGEEYIDPTYQSRRSKAFIIAVNCGQAGGTCFCTSMNTGPKVKTGFDLSLTEITGEDNHRFLVEIGSARGTEVMNNVPKEKAAENEIAMAEEIVSETVKHMGRELNTNGLKEVLYNSYDSPHWDDIASRCLSCANCTLVCPTCFCSSVEDTTDLTDKHAERWRKWASCFTVDFSYIHGGSVRTSVQSRYRQWITHKLASWIDQFGTSGCVGCGRCITWCPAAIDITKEAVALRESSVQKEHISPEAK
jgi:formate hydrogenlyase subunit 6/NADH:ubiquinone oxidoreductase subunit I